MCADMGGWMVDRVRVWRDDGVCGLEEVDVTSSTAHPVPLSARETSTHTLSWVAAMVGVFVASLGGWLIVAPDDGTITVNGRTWAATDLAGSWGPGLLIAGGAVGVVALMYLAVRDRHRQVNSWLVAGELVLAAAALVAVGIGIAVLI